jgi:tRNA1(Val) A37 N6-methylase TrmN6
VTRTVWREADFGELSDDAIAGDYRIWQRVRGHRYSLDDVATAWEAAQLALPHASRLLDLGCGIGSVTLMLAYAFPAATITGIEAQEISFELARRNITRNELDTRIELVFGDLREVAPRMEPQFDLVTGTPPYFDPQKSSPSTDSQRTHARIEMRGGIEEYLRAGAQCLAASGRMVVCGDARRPDRVQTGAKAAGLQLLTRRDVVPRAGKSALFTIWTLARISNDAERGEVIEHEPLVTRDENGARTEQAHALRRFFGLKVNEAEGPSPPLRVRVSR